MTGARLRAEDAADLEVVAAHLQDAILRVADIVWLPRQRRFAGVVTRFCWEHVNPATGRPVSGKSYYRTRSGFHIDSVLAVRARGFDQSDAEALLVLLGVAFEPGPDGAGTLELSFAGGAQIALEVECLDVSLSDQTAPWPSDQRPQHEENNTHGA